jgi:protein TonB
MRWLFTLASIAVHAGAIGWLAWVGRTAPPHKPTFVAVVKNKPKPKEAEKKEEEPKPKPKPPPVVKQAEPPPIVLPAPAPPPAPASAAPRFASNVTLGNGPAVAATGALGGSAGPPRPPEAERKAKPAPPPAGKVEDPCDAPDTKPRPLGAVTVEYPDKARADGVEGRIAVRIHVADDGSVESLEVLESVEASLDAVVLSVLKTWKFAPATHCGKPVAGVLAWAQRFELGD